jgi:signal peptidase I
VRTQALVASALLVVAVGLAAGPALSGARRVGPPLKRVHYRYVYAFVASGSMEPTIHCANRADPNCLGKRPDGLLQAASGTRGVGRGDIIYFRYPPAATGICKPGPGATVKRVIGLPGDRVVERHGVISVNGRVLKEPYVPTSERENHSGSWLVPKRSLFVAGDNRKISCDSRYWGPLPDSLVLGKVVEIIRPAPDGSDPTGPPIVHVTYPYQARGGGSAAMEPTIRCAPPGRDCTAKYDDLTLIELSGARQIRRGDIISFQLPPAANRFCGQGEAIERVIGLPGDQVTEHKGTISINGQPLPEPYIPNHERDHRSGTWHVPHGTYFVMADYRKYSCDSRIWGPLPANRIKGRVVEIIRHIPDS